MQGVYGATAERARAASLRFGRKGTGAGPRGLLIIGHGRRQILWFGVTAHPTAEWLAISSLKPLGANPSYLIRDRDRAYVEIFARRVRSIGIRDRPTPFRSPWQNGYAERLIGSIVQSGGNALIMSWCSANAICATFCVHTKITTTPRALCH